MRTLLIITLTLALLAAPFLLFGELGANQLAAWREHPPSKTTIAWATFALLASDFVLPVPSGPVATFAGAQLGWPLATLVAWSGMTVGCVAAFAAAKRWGPPLAERLSSPSELTAARGLAESQGVGVLLATRPLPILAEAAVLTLGLLGAPWRKFLPTVAGAHVVIAAFYAIVGEQAAEREWLLPALFIVAALPLALVWLLRSKRAPLSRRG
jgi:3-dehydroquinate synthase